MEKFTRVYDSGWKFLDEGSGAGRDGARPGDIIIERTFEDQDDRFAISDNLLIYNGLEWKSAYRTGARCLPILKSEIERLGFYLKTEA